MEYFGQKRDTNLWNEIYKPLITERTKTLLLQQWNALFARICHKIDNLIQEISDNKYVLYLMPHFELKQPYQYFH